MISGLPIEITRPLRKTPSGSDYRCTRKAAFSLIWSSLRFEGRRRLPLIHPPKKENDHPREQGQDVDEPERPGGILHGKGQGDVH